MGKYVVMHDAIIVFTIINRRKYSFCTVHEGVSSYWRISNTAEITLTHQACAPLLVFSILEADIPRFRTQIVPKQYEKSLCLECFITLSVHEFNSENYQVN